MPWKSRSLLLSLFGTIYVLVAAMRGSSDGALGVVALLLLPFGLLFVWKWSERPARGERYAAIFRAEERKCELLLVKQSPGGARRYLREASYRERHERACL